MVQNVSNHLQQNFPFLYQKRILLAVSGGVDSMVLTDLFLKLVKGKNIGIAHCNFQLRGMESDEDEILVKEVAAENAVSFFSTSFKTKEYAALNKVSIQIAARELRYNWFEQIKEQYNFDYVITAHHADDVAETFIMHLIRGTGLDGLQGIPKVNNYILRPLLPFSRKEILEYAKENKIKWREDASNASLKYVRNKIRHQVIPVFKEENPSFLSSFQQTLLHLKEAQLLIEDAVTSFKNEVCTLEDGMLKLNINKALKYENLRVYLYKILKPYGFTAWEDIERLLTSQSGKQIWSENYILLKDRSFLLLKEKKYDAKEEFYQINEKDIEINQPISLKFDTFQKKEDIKSSKNELFADRDKMVFPLYLRKRREGDIFFPQGMKGKKKVSKYFKDEKLSLFAKENTWLLTDANHQIIWIVGQRADERFKTDQSTKTIINIKFNS